MTRKVTFSASLPAIQSAISISGNGDGARLKLDIPNSDADVIPLIQMFFAGVPFSVTFERMGEYAEELGDATESTNEL